MKKIIICENIEKSFGIGSEKRNVLNGVTAQIYENEFVSFMGASGSGKSTLMFVMSGMDYVDSGRITFDGKDLSALSENELARMRRTSMGIVFQQPTMLKNLNVLDNITLPSISNNRKNAAIITKKAKILMGKIGITDLAMRDVTQVSGGQLQRAGICRALIQDPKIIFGDEPTGALNSKCAQEIMEIFSKINAEGTTVMLVTHDARIAAQTERVMFMGDGKIVSEIRLAKFRGIDIENRMKKVLDTMQEIGI